MQLGKQEVVVLSGHGANDAMNGLMRCISELIEARGYITRFYDLSRTQPEELTALARLLVGGSVAFAVSFLGVGQELAINVGESTEPVNVWDYAGVPLIKLHGDTPAYFLQRHADTPPTAINAYYFDEHLKFRQWMLPSARSAAVTIDPFIISDTPRAEIDFSARSRGTLVFVKNGGDADALMALWAQNLPETLSDQLIELALEITGPALKSGPFVVHEFVGDRLAEKGLDPRALRRLVRLYTAQLDDYLRRVKSTMVAKALLRFPVVIQGAGWDHIDVTAARARIAPPLDFAATEAVFQTELGVIDMTPNVDGCGHDRMLRAAGTYAFGLANRFSWLDALAPELGAKSYTFEPEAIAASVDHALTHRAECVSLGEAYGEAFRKRYDPDAWVEQLALLADASRLENSPKGPPLQPYFVW